MNINNKENFHETNNENKNSKSQMDHKNINTMQTNHNKKYIQYIKPLLLLLQKAEQIINIINLPTSSIDKYNQLKEISFKKCGLEFTPLIKHDDILKNLKKENNDINKYQENNKEISVNNKENELSEIKSKLIESLLTLTETLNYSNYSIQNKNSKENFSFNLSVNNFTQTCHNLKDEILKIESNNNEEINSTKEKILNYISRSEQNMIPILLDNIKKFTELKESLIAINSKLENLFKYINNIDQLISPIWNKYYNKELEWFNANKINDNYELKTYTKCNFLLNFMNQLFLDNKNIMEALNQMEEKKNEAYNILKLPYVRKAIEKGEYLKNVENLLNKIKKDKEKNNNIDMNKLIKDGKELINCIKETINEEPEKNTEGNIDTNNNIGNNVINTEEIDNYNDDMNIFLGKLMNGIQNILNKVDISIKKDELIENMVKVNNISKNKNLDNSSINNINTNLNINSTINNGTLSKDISFISTINNDNNKTYSQNIPSQIYQKKTNHISRSTINKYNDDNSDKKFIKEFNNINIQKIDIKQKVIPKQRIEKIKVNQDNINLNNNNNDNNMINDKILIQSINNIINDKDENIDFKNKNINNIKIINNESNEEKAITIGDIGNNLSDVESSQKSKSVKDSLNLPIKEIDKREKIEEIEEKEKTGLEQLKNMVLEDFKNRINEEKGNNEYN